MVTINYKTCTTNDIICLFSQGLKNKIVRLNDLNLNKLPLIKINLTPVTPYVETSESHLHQFSLNM